MAIIYLGDVMDRPMVQLYLGVLFGAIVYFSYSYMGIIPAVALGLIYIILLKRDFKPYLTIVIIGFFLLSFINCHIYFNGIEPSNYLECRVLEARKGYYIGSYNNRKLKILVKDDKIQVGRKYILKGTFNSNVDYERGIIGDYIASEYEPLKEDLIYKGYKLKENLYEKLVKATDDDGAAIILGVSAGDASHIDYDKREEFNVLGITHIISVSGLHVSVIYQVLQGIIGYKLSLIVLFFYVIFTGGEASTVRSFIMIALLVLSTKVRKRYEGVSSLSFAAFILLIVKPYYILDLGYMLSFLSVLGLFLLNKKIRRWLYKLPDIIGESLSLSISSLVFTTPYIILRFNSVSFGGLISNMLLIPFYTFLVVLGNLLLIFINIPIVFNFIAMMLNPILLIIRTIEAMLINIIPTPISFTYIEGIMILFLYLSYFLIKKGVNSLKYLPIALMILVIKEQYIIFPEINFIAGKNVDIVHINYKNRNIMISPEKVKLKYIYEDYGDIDRIYDEFQDEISVDLSENQSLDVKVSGGIMSVNLKYKESATKINIDRNIATENSDDEEVICCSLNEYNLEDKNCDIINLIRKKDSIKLGRYYESYKIINGKVYHNYIH
ncbi:MAG: ComEC/Rec2 family competence protein [Clostridium sp.]|uniref:ComEC/Rec2 family competence protein n=2 Tax=Clostridium sp. TaxID=1506 RepID=UPI0030524398